MVWYVYFDVMDGYVGMIVIPVCWYGRAFEGKHILHQLVHLTIHCLLALYVAITTDISK